MIKFKVFDVTVKIDFLFVAAVTLFSLFDKTGFSLIGIAVCFMHEIGHIIAFFIIGAKPREISFELAGIKLSEPYGSLSLCKELFVILSGSFVNIVCFFILSGDLEKGITNMNMFAVFHLLIGCFNLMPIKCFDGGKLIKLLLSPFLSEKVVFRITFILDFLSVIFLVCLCVIFAVKAKNSITLVIMTVYLIASSIFKVVNYKKI